MLRRIVRSYYRVRYFPRRVIEMLTGISNAIARLHRYEADVISQLTSAHEERLAKVHEEIAAFCDDAIRAMVTVSASIADIHTRIGVVQNGVQRLDNGAVEAQGRMAGLQQSLQHLRDQAAEEGPGRPAPHTVEALTELVRRQASQIERIQAMMTEQARFRSQLPVPAAASAASNGPGQVAGDDSLLSRA